MWSRLIVTALCGVTLACSEPSQAPSDPPLPPAEFSLTGRVSDLNSGAPLSGASIAVVDGTNAGRATTAGADGTYALVLKPGGFTMRVRYDGYDSVFQGVTFVANTAVDIQMRPARQTLAGTWAGALSFVQAGTGSTQVAIPQLAMTQAGTTIAATFSTSSPYGGSFSGTLRDPASIASSTDTSGTLTVTYFLSGRNPMTCRGTAAFTGTVTFARAVLTSPEVALDCGMAVTAVTIALDRQQ